MNPNQRRAVQVIVVILCCFGIYTYTAVFTKVVHYCDYTGLEIQGRLGHEVIFDFHNGTRKYYSCVNVSLLAFQDIKDTETIDVLRNILVRCPVCGMIMNWDDLMIVWVYSEMYLNPTTNTPTIVPLCANTGPNILCEGHFMADYGGNIVGNPYLWS